jgi:coenzyme F420-reducing hydrogenase delta subunit
MIPIGKSGLKTFESGGRMTIKTNADWKEILQAIRTLAERTKIKRRQAVRQGELSMKELEQLKERVDQLEKTVQMLAEIVENLVKQEAKASSRRRWFRWIR